MVNNEKETFSYYTYGSNDIDECDKKLIWNVIVREQDAIIVYNVFDHGSLKRELYGLKKECKDDFGKFEDGLVSIMRYYFWAKYEWEFVATSWTPRIDSEEIDRLVEERNKYLNEWGHFYSASVNLSCGEKLDVYTQLRMNWKQFVDYLWNHRNLIKKPK